MKCKICKDKHYLICTRDDGLEAVERCDACSEDMYDDTDAANLAQKDGVDCMDTYPCYLRNQQ